MLFGQVPSFLTLYLLFYVTYMAVRRPIYYSPSLLVDTTATTIPYFILAAPCFVCFHMTS